VGNSLQDQLLKLGLVDEHRAKKLKSDKHKQAKRQRNRKGKAVDQDKQQAQQAQAAKAERDRQLNQQRQEEAERKARLAQIKQLIEANRLPKGDGEIAYNFTDGQKIKRLYVNETVHQRLSGGSAAIVKLHGQYNIVPADIAEKIRQRDEACVILLNQSKPDEDDPYADYPVPDDLIW